VRFLIPEEVKKVDQVAISPDTGSMSAQVVGQSVPFKAKLADI